MNTPTDLYCQATLQYASADIGVTALEVPIHNARQLEQQSWLTQGFELVQATSAVEDWDDPVDVSAHYYAEMEALARAMTGCDAALIAGHICRNPQTAADHADYAPIQYAHSDFTASYAELLRKRYLHPEAETAAALERTGLNAQDVAQAQRLVVLQFWRNVGSVEPDLPLAFCDRRSYQRDDLLAIHVPNYAGGGDPFDAFGLQPPTGDTEHQWYCYPKLTADEAVAFQTFDSEAAEKGEKFATPHCAFTDPLVAHPQPRRSIDERATCVFG